ncbi:triose-phosphate isomerase [Dolosigranulum savutiense]|uniref:Triose-phosphate isomerase n=1 Tax=Dolosigranulum savutiense TaxID=3110288 RepID=A0AB74U3P4_9LACT
MKYKVNTPFFIFNPKSYFTGEKIQEFAFLAEKLAEKYTELSIFMTAPFADLQKITAHTRNIIVTAQHMDGIEPGRGMGYVLPESLYESGVKAVFLNHAEKPMNFSELVKSIERANELDIITIVCADSIKEAKAIATLNPDIILCEPTKLIGTGQTSNDEYIRETNEAIKQINPDILVMQAAGISNADDVYKVISLGADGTGCTSGITEADNPKEMFESMIYSVKSAKRELEQ